MNSISRFFLFFLLVSCFSCSDYSPKPYGYYRIELKEHSYSLIATAKSGFTLSVADIAHVEIVPDTLPGEWFNIVYPSLNATIYCSYIPVPHGQFAELAEASRKLVYVHVLKASSISEQVYADPANRVYSIIYTINGNVATPVQFLSTDSVTHIFRGSLYFDNASNQDSIAPVVDYIRQDIQELAINLRWPEPVSRLSLK